MESKSLRELVGFVEAQVHAPVKMWGALVFVEVEGAHESKVFVGTSDVRLGEILATIAMDFPAIVRDIMEGQQQERAQQPKH